MPDKTPEEPLADTQLTEMDLEAAVGGALSTSINPCLKTVQPCWKPISTSVDVIRTT